MKKIWMWLCALALVGCGGGAVVDSPSVTLSGTAATGLPIANANIDIKCSSASGAIVVGSTTTDANGAYRQTVSGAQAPCMVQVAYTNTMGAKVTLVGYAVQAGTANITPLTHALLTSGLSVPDVHTFFSGLNATGIQSLQAVNNTSLWAGVSATLNAQGVSTDGISNPFTDTLLADPDHLGKGHDGVLDALKTKGYTTAQLVSLANTVNADGSGGVVSPTLVSIQIEPPTASKPAGLRQQYTALGTYNYGPNKDITAAVSWSSSNTATATVDAAGLAAALAAGTSQITAQLSGLSSNTATLTVIPAQLVSIEITPATATVGEGLTQQYTAMGTYTAGPPQDLTGTAAWNSSDTAKASINAAGLATVLSTGSTNITAQLSGITSNSASLEGAARAFAATQSMNAVRSGHTATLLLGGKVLVAGGSGSSGVVSSAELYDPATGTWTATGFMSTPRTNYTATLLPGGKVLVAGGVSSTGDLASAELYDPTTGTWTSTSPMSTSRVNHTAMLLPGGKVLVAGGFGSAGELAIAELYDPTTGTWTATASMSTSRSVHTGTLLLGGKVLVAGGVGPSGYLDSAELYDPASGEWSSAGSMGTSRTGHTATLLPGGRVVLVGGDGSGGATALVDLY